MTVNKALDINSEKRLPGRAVILGHVTSHRKSGPLPFSILDSAVDGCIAFVLFNYWIIYADILDIFTSNYHSCFAKYPRHIRCFHVEL